MTDPNAKRSPSTSGLADVDVDQPSTVDPHTLMPTDPAPQLPTTTRPSPPQWRPDSQPRYRLSPWGIATPLILLAIALNSSLSGVAFSFGAFLIELGLIFWLVIILRKGLDQPYSALLLPLGFVSLLMGLEWIVNIPFWSVLLVVLAVWLIWRQFDKLSG